MASEPKPSRERSEASPVPTEPALEGSGAAEASGSGASSPTAVERYNAAGWKIRARRVLGVSPHALVGALHGASADETYTETQVRKRLDAFEGLTGVEPVAEESDDSEA